MSQQNFLVDGLHCQSCVRIVTGALTALPSVSAVEVDLGADGPSTVRVDAVADLSVDEIQAALREEGDYTVVS
ncbi:heavy metal-associated domain-containing protein [Mycobacterium sp. CVI_P3]|uniref:Heavy metal-associated domain-containing protein n=1 Tax=Mycobacterium pinniadriaticum TaxID=2994102 RepID=A0ABT3SC88_9MYCO|nr:heavy metal-associated domain-containing protein [Mycobacterium pinniadriaticum]MCX2930563.1 heavy metal-associated domain-containing protein [Mycobacterium pinniadriaticum]MCX2936987.1 heavy metal-associated domain-containing protein [Mycobacterium pinniadriaticum]